MDKYLVIGASGQVGGALLKELECRNFECFGTYNQNMPPERTLLHLDLTDAGAVVDIFKKVQPRFVFLPASFTNVDRCESEPELSHAVNVQAVKNVVDCVAASAASLIYFSSDYIFDGKNGPYSEDDTVCPISVYGRQKVQAEEIVRTLPQSQWLIVRTTVVYGREWQKKNFVLRLLSSLADGDAIPVAEDQIGTPTLNTALARSSVALVEAGINGIFNVAGEESASRYQFAMAVADEFDLPGDLIIPIKTDMLDQKAARPLRAGLKIDKLKNVLSDRAVTTGFYHALAELRLEIDMETAEEDRID